MQPKLIKWYKKIVDFGWLHWNLMMKIPAWHFFPVDYFCAFFLYLLRSASCIFYAMLYTCSSQCSVELLQNETRHIKQCNVMARLLYLCCWKIDFLFLVSVWTGGKLFLRLARSPFTELKWKFASIVTENQLWYFFSNWRETDFPFSFSVLWEIEKLFVASQ